ncbi:NAD-dependent epimerase/dehydratase family protein [Mycetocola zhadangensis]|uniref:NAD-dependent epimerase/dehydratase family protein n=1 Tax=Mycetocola zhadangensis TaxID=1164595 RepID=A0A3L7ITE4_9MICO|nr:NAD-dependent epimerase/dehydratase family protein [Mycetocola zhadangensis]RLQ81538.1 NAD-dependent epimerase/dehydratase family protein [Mycetocola zhadangensis]RLQ82492.1 NAD-dependent epimerase/dehydratase family protein [Mycetocola zhadangensis]GGF00810.1 hypothetical protein GCM10011313_24810 [Mycetocola zhadangensis]
MTLRVWTIGARGLLGAACVRSVLRRAPYWVAHESRPLPWSDASRFADAVDEAGREFIDALNEGDEWAVLWAGGAAVTSTPQALLDHEIDQLTIALDAIGRAARIRNVESQGTFFYASSAGGVYGGSVDPPFDERTLPAPISPYGQFKVVAEKTVRQFSDRYEVSSAIGRISNLYGPGQRMDKMQGIISHLALAQYSPRPASIFVPLETVRDYFYVDDCADLVCRFVGRVRDETRTAGTVSVTKNLVSGQGVTIGELLGLMRDVSKGHPHVMLGSSSTAALQAVDLRIQSNVWPELDRVEKTPLAAGIFATMQNILSSIQRGQ